MEKSKVFIIVGVIVLILVIVSVASLVFAQTNDNTKTPPSPSSNPCNKYEKLRDNVDSVDYNLYAKSLDTLDECFNACDADGKCNWVSWSPEGKNCILKSWSKGPADGQTFVNNELSVVPASSFDECSQSCISNTGCAIAVYNNVDQCKLYEGKSGGYTAYYNTERMSG